VVTGAWYKLFPTLAKRDRMRDIVVEQEKQSA
jgi:hypothetical protein